jgi:predicted GIY-YIG superfamily endonuclease
MINITLPDITEFEKIRVRLDNSRPVKHKNRKMTNPPQTYLPINIDQQNNRKGVYIIQKDNVVKYIGMTENLGKRMLAHNYLRKNSDIKFIYFLKEDDRQKRAFYEIIYKYHFRQRNILETKYPK